MIKNTPIHGIIFLLRGFRMLTRKGLKRFVIPAAIIGATMLKIEWD